MSGFGLPDPYDEAREFVRRALRFIVKFCLLAAVLWLAA